MKRYRRYPPKLGFEEWVLAVFVVALVAIAVYRLAS
jgi:hypothetical protein